MIATSKGTVRGQSESEFELQTDGFIMIFHQLKPKIVIHFAESNQYVKVCTSNKHSNTDLQSLMSMTQIIHSYLVKGICIVASSPNYSKSKTLHKVRISL